MSRHWSDRVRGLVPYVPGEQPSLAGLVKLNTNENPYPPSPRVLEALRQAAGETLRLYPEPSSRVVREAVAAQQGLSPDEVFVGNGSDEVLALAFMALMQHGERPVLFPDVSYAFYPVYCGLYGIPFRTVALDADFRLDVDAYVQSDAAAIVFPNPNAPTGRAVPRADIDRLLQACADKVVVIDEAYADFGAESAAPLIARHDNLLVVQTLSKSRSLAGLRVGFATGQSTLIEALTRVKDSFNSYPVDRLAQAGAVAAIEDTAWFEQTRRAVMATRERLVAVLRDLGFETLPSQANFVFTRHPLHPGARLAAALRERGILVRRFDRPERIADFLRISIGTEDQCDLLIRALKELTHAAV
jgi:histidinol-phosphate aminotransferase